MTNPKDSLLRGPADWLIRWRFALLIGGLALFLAAWPFAQKLSFDQKIESLYADDDPHIVNFLESKSLFGGDEFVIVAYDDPELFVPGSLADDPRLLPESRQRILKFVSQLNAIEGIQQDQTQHLAAALEFPYRRKRVMGLVDRVLVDDDRRTPAIVLRLEPEDSLSSASPVGGGKQDARPKTFAEIRRVAGEHNPPAYVVGEPLQVHDMFRYVEQDGRVLFRLSLGLLAAVLFLFFACPPFAEMRRAVAGGLGGVAGFVGKLLVRVLQWVGLPIVVVVVTIVWTEALLVVSGLKLSMVSSMLNSMVTIIAIATVTHVTVHYRELRRTMDRVEAFRLTFIELLPAIFWTCATTAAGFGALLSSSITPAQSFGKMMALGSGVVFAATIVVLPGGILIGRFSTDPLDAPAEARLVRFLLGLTGWIERRPKLLSTVAFVAVAFTAVGLLRLEVETDFSKNFRESSDIVRSLNFVETRLGGTGTWEVNFPAPEKLTDEYLDRVRRLAANLRKINAGKQDAPRPTKVIAITDALDLVPESVKLPFLGTTKLSIDRRLQMVKVLQPDFESTLYNRDQGRMRIMLRARERQSSTSKLSLIEAAEQAARRAFPPEKATDPEPKATGLFVLLTFLIESLLRDQMVAFAWASLGIGVMMTAAFLLDELGHRRRIGAPFDWPAVGRAALRSLVVGVISLVPNIFPIVLVIGTIGWIGLPVNIATAMIASVSMGLTVDSTIHYIAAFRRARRCGLDVGASLRECHRGVGRALVFANIALVIGFTVLTLSNFIPLVYFGMLLSVAMIGGLFGDLVLLPLLLQWAEQRGLGEPVEARSSVLQPSR